MKEIDFLSGRNYNEVRPPVLEDEYIGDAELLDAYSNNLRAELFQALTNCTNF